MKIKSAFILHSFPMLYSPKSIPELGEKENFYALIPTEELALLNNSTWPVVIDHADEKEKSVGNCSAKIIDSSFLFSNDITVDLKKCTIEDIKNFNRWDETSTSFKYNIIKLKPYYFVDNKGISGNVGDKYLIKYHIINLHPVHLAIVEAGRTGYKGMLRKPLEHSLDNSITDAVKSDIIIHNSIKSLCVINNKVLTPVEKQNKLKDSKDNSENTENSDDKEIKNESSELTLDSIKSMFMELLTPMVSKLDSLENKVNSMFSEDDNYSDEDEELMNKKKSSKLQNSKASEDEEDDENDEDDEYEDDEDDEDDEEDEEEDLKIENSKSLKASKNKSSKKKEVIFNSSDIKRQLKAALLEIAPALKNSRSDEDEKDPYDSFAQRYKN